MKRPFALVGFTVLPCLAAAVFLGADISLFLACCCLAGFGICLFLPRLHRVGVASLALLAASLAFGSFSAYTQAALKPAEAWDGQDAQFTGVICELPERTGGRYRYVVRVESLSLSETPQNFKLLLSTQNALKVQPYSRLSGRLHLSLPRGNGFSQRSSYASKGILLFAFLYEYEDFTIFPPENTPPYAYALRARSALRRSLQELLPKEESGLACAMLLGDKSGVSDETISDFRVAGVSHMMAVSGLHMAVMLQLFLFLFSTLLCLPKKLSHGLSAAMVLCFMAVTGFAPSVVRSGVMCLILLLGQVFSRRADTLNSLGFAVLLLCLFNPYAAADIGLLLSFSATLGLVLLAGPATGWLNARTPQKGVLGRLFRGGNSILGASAGAILFTLPVSILTFGSVSLIAPLSNLLTLWLCTLLLPCSALAAVFQLLLPQTGLSLLFALPTGLLSKGMAAAVHALAQIPLANVPLSGGHVVLWVAASLALLAVAVFLGKKRIFKAAACLVVILLLVDVLSFQISSRNGLRVAVMGDGAQLCVAVTCNGRAAVFGCNDYSSGNAESYLRAQGVQSLDYLQPLSSQRREVHTAAGLLQSFPTGRLFLSASVEPDGFLERAWQNAEFVQRYENTAAVSLWGRVSARTAQGAVLLTADNVTLLLCPEKTDLSLLPEQWLQSDFAVLGGLPQHGELLLSRAGILCGWPNGEEIPRETLTRLRFPLYFPGEGNLIVQTREEGPFTFRKE